MEHDYKNHTLGIEGEAFSKQHYQFWTLQISGWLGYALLVFFAIVRPQFDEVHFNLSRQLVNLFLETLCGFFLSYLQWLFIQKIVHLPVKKTLILSFTSAACLGVIYNIIKLSCYKVVVYQQEWDQGWEMLEFGGWLMFSLTTMFAWTALFFIMLYNAKLQKEHEMFLTATSLAKDTQLKMLRYQLNPHFMFNTMNAISTLILKSENEKANDMLDKLCDFFRYTLRDHSKTHTTLRKELELLELYLSIEKVRFSERLNVNIDINENVMDCLVPCMLLQPLVENAIKYAVEPKKEAGFINIDAQSKENRLLLNITDSGGVKSTEATQGFGIGIGNTRSRLDVMFNGDYSIDIEDLLEEGTRVSISLPYKK